MAECPDIHVDLARLAAGAPGRLEVLESLGVDLVAADGLTLAEACRDLGIDPWYVALLMRDVAWDAPRGRGDGSELGVASLAAHIERVHHRFVRRQLARIDALAFRLVAGCPPARGGRARIEELVFDLETEVQAHLTEEEQQVFPEIRRLALPRHGADTTKERLRLAPLEQDHRRVDRLADLLSEAVERVDTGAGGRLLHAGLREAVGLFRLDLGEHVRKESRLLFPKAIALAARSPGARSG